MVSERFGAIAGSLTLSGASAFLADAGSLGSESALTGLATITASSSLYLEDGASLATTGALTSTGTIEIEGNVGETTTLDANSAAGLGTAGAITGGVYLFGSASAPAILEFASASITSIGTAGTAGYLELDGPDAFVADAGSLTSNSALTQLATVTAGSTLYLANGSSVTTNVALANSGRKKRCISTMTGLEVRA